MVKKNSNSYKILTVVYSVAITAAIGYLIVWAGNLNPPGTPADTMKTLDDIYYELDKNAPATSSWGLDPSATPTSTMYTLQEIYDKTPKFHSDPGNASTSDVCNSATFYKDSATKLTGTRTDCSSPGVTKTGQTTSYASSQTCGDGGTGGCDDGYYEKGQALNYTYTDNGDGTVTDNNTGLMWKRCSEPDTGTSGCTGTHSTSTWQGAINQCEGLNYAGYTDWRLPNAKELWSITRLEPETAPYINQTAFPGTVSGNYWSSTTYPDYTTAALSVRFSHGCLSAYGKTDNSYYVRCVRGQ